MKTSYPLRLIAIVAAAIFVVESVIMVLLPLLRLGSAWGETLLDAGSLVLSLVPVLYFFLLRPMTAETEGRAAAERRLQALNADLEARVADRTRELEDACVRAACNESKYKEILDETADLVQSVDPQGRIVYANGAMLAALGYSSEELNALNIFDVIAPECREHCAAVMARVMKGEASGPIETAFRAKSGARVLVRGKASCHFKDGRPEYTRGVFRDVTAQVRAEKRLAAQFAATKALAESAQWREGIGGVLRGIGAALDCVAAGVWELGPGEGDLRCADFWTPSGRSTPFTRQSREIRFAPGEGLPGRAWSAGRTAWIEDAPADPNFPRAATASADGIVSGVAFPVMLDGRVEGVLEFYVASRQIPDEELLELFAAVGSQAGEFLRRRRADEALARSLRELSDLKTALDSSALVSTTDAEGRIIGVNERFMEVSGYSREELLGRTHRIVNSSRHSKEFFRQMWETIRGGRTWRGEVANRAKDGSIYWVDMTVFPFVGADGRPFRYIAIRHVITEAKNAAARVAAARARLQAVLDNATQVAIVACDEAGAITIFNKGAENLLGYAPREMLGKPPLTLHDPEEIAARGKLLSMELGRPVSGLEVLVRSARGGGFESREWTYVRKDGSRFPVNLTVTALRDGEGGINGFLAIGVDMSQARAAQSALAAARDAALGLARAKSEFLANMSHEIRTPMNAVIGMTGLLLDTPLTPRQREFAEIIRNAGESLMAIISDILDFSKIEAGKMPLEVLDFNPRVVLEDVAMLFAARAQDKGLEIAAVVDGGMPPRLRGDAGRLRQILSNFVGNAVKFTEKGEVVVAARKVSESGDSMRLRFEVRDTGIGLDEAARSKLFTAFTQADASTTRKYGGTGLGLAICKKLVELMGGTIGIESRPGEGSTFWFEVDLPRGEGAPMASPPEIEGVRVLIVDDNATNRQILTQQAESWRMRPLAVADAQRALEALRRAVAEADPFLLALVDMQMPGMDGAALARAVKTDASLAGLKMILLSSMGLSLGDEALRGLGCDASLTKPVRKSSLFDAISDVLSARPSSPAPVAASASAPPPAWSGLRILVAEDNLVNQKIALMQLGKLGCRADAVANGREAVEAALSIHYDLILMDCQMPEMDGFEATAAIRKRLASSEQRTVIVAMTANALEGDRERCLAAGMDDYVSKPVRIEALAAAVRRWFAAEEVAAAPPGGRTAS